MPIGTTAALIAAGGLSAAGSVGGALASKGASGRSEEQQAQALQQWLDLNVPNPKDQEIYLEQLVSQGKLSPQLEGRIRQGKTEMAGIQLDPKMRQAQMSALGELQNIGEGGPRLRDKAAMQQMLSEVNQNEMGKRGALEQEMARRGVGGSAMEYGMKQANQQSANQQAALMGLQNAANQQDRSLAAIMGAGEMGGKMRGQDWQQASDVAKSQDLINRFNTGNALGVQQRNVGSQNYAQEANLNNAQRISDANTGIRNTQEMHNKGLIQQEYLNKLNKTKGLSSAYGSAADASAAEAAAIRDQWYKAGSGLGKVASGAAGLGKKGIKSTESPSLNPNEVSMVDAEAAEELDKLNKKKDIPYGWNA